MREKKRFLVNFMVRAILGCGMILLANQILEQREIGISVGINAVSFVVSGCLGVPGVAMLYGIVGM